MTEKKKEKRKIVLLEKHTDKPDGLVTRIWDEVVLYFYDCHI